MQDDDDAAAFQNKKPFFIQPNKYLAVQRHNIKLPFIFFSPKALQKLAYDLENWMTINEL